MPGSEGEIKRPIQSPLDAAVMGLAERIRSDHREEILGIEVAAQASHLECRLIGEQRDLHLSTEGNEITLTFAASHRHAYQFYVEGSLEPAIEEIIGLVRAILAGNTASYSVWNREHELGGGFASAQEFLECEQEHWGEWTEARFICWKSRDDTVLRRDAKN